MTCIDCDTRLTDEEFRYYEDRCERCEALWSVHMDLWRHGRIDDPELDATYGARCPC